ncbi:MAG TPA: AAA family ATPase [Anaerolineales bacterium]|nr:AAA family ATPase [Anaerolineales bacterium]
MKYNRGAPGGTALSTLNFYLLGAPRLERDGQPVELDTRKAIALLAYLVVSGKPHTRDTLAALLWPEYNQSNARAALRRTLSALRKALDPDTLEIIRDLVGLAQPVKFDCDLWDFQELLNQIKTHGHGPNQVCARCLEPLESAVGLFQGSFMAGFGLRDSPEFDDWQFFQGEELRHQLETTLEKLAHGYLARRDFEGALVHALRRLALDPLHEPSHRLVMEAYGRAGRRNAALHQYQECARILETELGVSPLEETTLLYQAIKEHKTPWEIGLPEERIQALPIQPDDRAAAPPAPVISNADSPITRLPLVGRHPEWKRLEAIYARLPQNGCFAVLEGEAGIGKTRLAEEFLASVRARGAPSIATRSYPGETSLAYAPFVEALRSALDQPGSSDRLAMLPDQWLREAARLNPEIASLRADLHPPPAQESPGAQTRLFEGVRQVVLALLEGENPGVLFFDDLQWADEATLDLLAYIVRRLQGSPFLVLATWRVEDRESNPHLRRLLADAQRDSTGEVISLERLALESVQELVGALPPSASNISLRLFQETEGLPFFISEYLAAVPNDRFTAAEMDWEIPHSVRALLGARLDQVAETGRQLLQTAAVIGRSFDFDTLLEASGRSEDETVTTLEMLIQRGLIRESQPGQNEPNLDSLRDLLYDFNHDKMRAQVYAEISLARRRILHQRVAEALARHSRGQRERAILAGQIAYHYKLGGRTQEAGEYYRQAGEQARKLYANQEALAHFQAALSLGHPATAWLNEAIGDIHTLLGAYSAALMAYENASAYQQDNPPRIAVLEQKLGDVFHRLGEWERAESHYQAAEKALQEQPEPSILSRLYADWSRTLHRQGQITLAEEMAGRALQLAENSGDELAHAQAHNILGMLKRKQGDLETAIHHLGQSLSVAEALADPGLRVAALNNLSLAYAEVPDLERAIQHAQQALELCSLQGDLHREAALHNNLADLYHATGQSEKAMGHLKQAVVIFAQVGAEEGEKPRPEIWKLTEW